MRPHLKGHGRLGLESRGRKIGLGFGGPHSLGLKALKVLVGMLVDVIEVVESRLQQLLEAINRELPQHERLAQLIVVRERWEVDNGFITPSLKIKRNQVEKFYHDVVHALSAKVEKVVWA